VRSNMGSRGFGTRLVQGRRRVPKPPANTTTCTVPPATGSSPHPSRNCLPDGEGSMFDGKFSALYLVFGSPTSFSAPLTSMCARASVQRRHLGRAT
jgi:hypothetical protein